MEVDFDMQEIVELFLEESFEGLDVMEQGLLNLDIGAPDPETINDIFRAAHSIKGGAATLGHMEVSGFTHGVETLLDEFRSGKRATTPENVQLLLRSVDHLRGMLTATSRKEPLDQPGTEALDAEIRAMLETTTAAGAPIEVEPVAGETVEGAEAETAGARIYRIRFRPHAQMLVRGNDPLLIFRELAKLGELTVTADAQAVPPLGELNPENSYLAWELTLETTAAPAAIGEAFEWVDDEADLEIAADGVSTAEGEPRPDGTMPSEASAPAGAGRGASAEPSTETPQGDSAEPADGGRRGDAAEPPAPAGPTQPAAAIANGSAPPNATRSAGDDDGKKQVAQRESTSIRVSTDKVDTLLNLVGELVITQSMLRRFGNEDVAFSANEFRDGLLQLERHTRELQESVMQIRMLPISFCFSRFPRLVHDLSRKLGKKIELQITGQQTELDKTVLEKIGDPLVHLIRNSLDHGIESVEARVAAGKPAMGVIKLSAAHEGGDIVIQVSDDGAGLNRDRILAKARDRGLVGPDETLSDERIHNLIFMPGFSTAESVSDVSGRGVGMDVVRRNIKDLGGRVDVQSEAGRGSTFTIRLPLTLAILDGQLVCVGRETFVVPLLSIVETVQVDTDRINQLPNGRMVYRMRDVYIPVTSLAETFGIRRDRKAFDERLLLIVEVDARHYGLFVDELLDQQQVVIKSLEENYRHVAGLSGATILGDGTVALILDVPGLVSRFNVDGARDVEAA